MPVLQVTQPSGLVSTDFIGDTSKPGTSKSINLQNYKRS